MAPWKSDGRWSPGVVWAAACIGLWCCSIHERWRFPLMVSASSAGNEGSCADASPSLCSHDCPNDDFPRPWATATGSNGAKRPCCPSGMDRVAPPIASAKYSVTFSTTTYSPCELVKVSVDVLDKDFKYLGLLLYAVPTGSDSGEADKVGTFVLPSKHAGDGNNAQPKFWTPPSCNGHALMHANAGVKHFHHEFAWQAPKAGTGAVEFRALIKQGETNGGSFYYPTFPDGKVLQEKDSASDDNVWILAPRGSTCEQMCQKRGGTCNEAKMQEALTSKSKDMLSGDIGNKFVCQKPFLSLGDDENAPCSEDKALSVDDHGFCYYRDSEACDYTDIKLCKVEVNARESFCLCEGASGRNKDSTCPIASLGLPSPDGTISSGDGTGSSSSSPPSGEDLTGGAEVVAKKSIEELGLDIVIVVSAATTTVQLAGPADRWWGIAFGAKTMADQPYALIFGESNTVAERRLGVYNEGRELPSSATVTEAYTSETDSFKQVRSFMRPSSSESLDDDYFDFLSGFREGASIDVMVAVGSDSGESALKYHSSLNRRAVTMEPELHVREDYAGVTSGTSRRAPTSGLWITIVFCVMLMFLNLWEYPLVANAHNWINNPKSRIVGLSKVAPCPPRPGNSLSFAVRQGSSFPIEWSTGHPNTYTYFSIVASENADKLAMHTEALLNDYLSSAPKDHSFLEGSFYDKIHMRWTGSEMPKVGDPADGGNKYSKKLANGDIGYFSRPSDWRVSRKCKNNACAGKTFSQYSYLPQYTNTDARAAYQSKKYPWLLAVFKYKISHKKPQDYDLARLAIPPFATVGEYVVQYLWRGYYDCFDVALLEGKGTSPDEGSGGGSDDASPPELVEETVWIKSDHCQYPTMTFGRNDFMCTLILSDGDVSDCLARCENENGCEAVNVVPLQNDPKVVSFGNDPNIPLGESKRCKPKKFIGAPAEARVCYGGIPPDPPEVGNSWVISDDPQDEVFYSTCYRRQVITKVKGSSQGEGGGDSTSQPTAEERPHAEWRWKDKCISCQDAVANAAAPLMNAPLWRLTDECSMCKA